MTYSADRIARSSSIALGLIDSDKHLLHNERFPLGRQGHRSLVNHHVEVAQVEQVGSDWDRLACQELV